MREKLLALAAAYRARAPEVTFMGSSRGICLAIWFGPVYFIPEECDVVSRRIMELPTVSGGGKWPMADFDSRASWLETLAEEVADA